MHLSANTSGYETENDPTSIGLRTRTPPMKIRNLEDILKRLQHHIQHHQGSSTSASVGGVDSSSPGIPGYDNGQVASSIVPNTNGTSSNVPASGANGTNVSGNSPLTSPEAGQHLF